ncbi:CBS domain-containing protein [Cohnella fermenti]|uniref:CBS domain-containing protein n=1 Tax=Cohnella fermenti TaxID=2565925 RepID=A0A4S4C7G7_9BACL|nr:GGDEF domain-containing protein [Cohnella fermenti]THF83234.1 CBS domain-containing protein [Cohnella fermenti]
MKVGEEMTRTVYSVTSDRSVLHASDLMGMHLIGSLLVVDSGAVVGIITSRDVRSTHPNRIVADAMTPNPIQVPEDTFVWDALNVMKQHGIERLVVYSDEGSPAGIVTREKLASRLAEWTDSMTGLFKAPYIEAIANAWLSSGETFHFLFVDLNDFGSINKKYGHPVGDDLIRGFAEKLVSVFGQEASLCRYAGDEFAVLTRNSASFVRSAIDTLSSGLSVGPAKLTASVGWMDMSRIADRDALTFRELVMRASLLSTKYKPAGKS